MIDNADYGACDKEAHTHYVSSTSSSFFTSSQLLTSTVHTASFLQSEEPPGQGGLNWLTISLSAIAHNIRYLRSLAPQSEFMAVLKADAYNHGLIPVAHTALAAGAQSIGVTTIAEALELRSAGIQVPLLVWIMGMHEPFEEAIRQHITLGISHPGHLEVIMAASRRLGYPAHIEIKVDTGMRRNGVNIHEWDTMVALIKSGVKNKLIEVKGIFTHFSHADQPENPTIEQQKNRLLSYADHLRNNDIDPGIIHCANTAALLAHPQVHCNRVRPGIGIYGYNPFGEPSNLQPAMQLSSTVIAVRPINAGDGVSYGHTWVAAQDGYVALLPIGYADGLLRGLGNKITVRIGEHIYPQIGKICMDQCVIDLGTNPHNVHIGQTAILLGDGRKGEMTVSQWAHLAGTIDYEIITLIRGRIHRRYTR